MQTTIHAICKAAKLKEPIKLSLPHNQRTDHPSCPLSSSCRKRLTFVLVNQEKYNVPDIMDILYEQFLASSSCWCHLKFSGFLVVLWRNGAWDLTVTTLIMVCNSPISCQLYHVYCRHFHSWINFYIMYIYYQFNSYMANIIFVLKNYRSIYLITGTKAMIEPSTGINLGCGLAAFPRFLMKCRTLEKAMRPRAAQ